MKKRLLLLFIIQSSLFTAFSQDQHLVDSLITKFNALQAEKKELRNDNASINDSITANILYALSKAYWGNNPDKAMDYANQCLTLSEQIGYKKGIGNAYNSMGAVNNTKGNYSIGLEFQKKALKIKEEINDKKGISDSYNTIGNIYQNQGKYPEALKNHIASLKIREAIGDKQGISASYNNIGLVYTSQENYPDAMKNHFSSLKISEEIGDKEGISASYNNIGLIYWHQGNYPEALKNNFASLKIKEEIGDKQGVASSYNNIGAIYCDNLSKYPEALKNFFASLKIREEIGDKNGIATSYGNIGVTYTREKKYKEASEYFKKGLTLAKEIGSLEMIKSNYNHLAILDSTQGNFNKALEHYKLFIIMRDSLNNNENTKKTVALQMNYEFNKKQVADSIKSTEEKKVIKAELKQEQTKSYALYGGLALMILVASVFFKQRNKIGKEKKRSDDLLLNILPAEVAEELKATGAAEAKQFDNVSVLFTDFVGFTNISERLSPKELVKEIHLCFTAFDEIIERNGLEKIKTIGDAYLAVCGMPMEDKDHAKNTVKTAIEIMAFMNSRKSEITNSKSEILHIRIGINSGPVVAGIVGVKKFAYDIWGDTVNTAARMEQHSQNGKINISGSTYELVKNDFKCEQRGKIEAKNKGEVDMYFVSEQI